MATGQLSKTLTALWQLIYSTSELLSQTAS